MWMRILVLSSLLTQTAAWGGSTSESPDLSVYGNSLSRDWLYDGSNVAIKLEGCMWGYLSSSNNNNGKDNNKDNKNKDGGNQDGGCMGQSSEDGTTYWYQMVNCMRAQAVFSVYASSGSVSCSSSNFKESFVTTQGVSTFIQTLKKYDANNPFGDNIYDADDGGDDGGKRRLGGGGENDRNNNNERNENGGGQQGGGFNLPTCQGNNGKYVGVGCTEDGSFALVYYNDQYCMSPTGSVSDKLRKLNRALKSYKTCQGVYSDGGDGGGLVENLIGISDTCSSLDSALCTDNSAMKKRHYGKSASAATASKSSSGVGGLYATWLTKAKYVVGGLLLLASFIMFTGILFTNRRRRRALLQRKYRQKNRDDRSRKSSRSKSKSRDKSRSSKSITKRTRSKSRDGDPSGVYT